MKYIFFIACFNAFFFLGLLLNKKPRFLHDRILIFWLLYLGIATGIYTLTIDFFPRAPFLSSGIIALFLLHGPFMYLYVSTLASNNKNFETHKLWHFAPFAVFILYLLIASRFPAYSEGIRVDHVTQGVAKPPLLFLLFLVMTALSGPVYFLLSYQRFRKIRDFRRDFTSRDIDMDWLGKLIYIFGVIWTIFIIIAVIHHVFHLFSMAFCINGLFLSLSAFIILIGYFGLKQKGVFISDSPEERKKPIPEKRTRYASSKLEGVDLEKCFHKIDDYLEAKKPYLDPDLTLPKLAKSLNVSHHHLSQVINEIYKQNFFEFINKYRVEEVKNKIVDPQFHNYSLLGIALESGFNSKSAFNRVFKKFTRTTPSKFRDSQLPA